MTITLDPITQRKLVLARQIYQRALIQAQLKHSYADRILAVIGFDLATESVLKAIVGALDPKKTTDKDFHGVLQQADSCLVANSLPGIPDKAKIQHVHDVRNDAQHKAKYPNETDVSDCRTYTRDFLEQVILDVWGQGFNSISLTSMVGNPNVRTYLTEAEKHLENAEYYEAVESAEAALRWSLRMIKRHIVGPFPRLDAVLIAPSSGRQAPSREVARSIELMRDMLVRSTVGLDFRSYVRYRQIVSSAIQSMSFLQDGNYEVNRNVGTPSQAEAEFVLEFGINAVIQIESLVGDIEKPFDLDEFDSI